MLAVRPDQRLWVGRTQARVDGRAGGLPAGAWRRASAGAGSKGQRWYDGAVQAHGPVDERGGQWWFLVRRHRERPAERADSLCRGPAATPWQELVRAAGRRWAVEECFATAKGACGLDEYAVRSWVGWHRHVTLSLFALAVLTVIRSRAAAAAGRKRGGAGLLPLTVPEVRKLLRRLVWERLTPAEQALAWSAWRRAHQQRARQCHYRARGARPPN